VKNLIIEGSATGEGYGSPPRDIRAYNVLTGKMVWISHTIPHPGEFGYNTWPKGAWKTAGGANCWGEMTIPSLVGVTKKLDANSIKNLIRSGLGEMTGFKDLDDSELNAMIAFLGNPKSGAPPPGHRNRYELPMLRPPRNGKLPVRYWSGYGYMRTKEIPAGVKPPWSTVTKYDLNNGTIQWQVPFGNTPELAARGIFGTGNLWPRNGVVVTGGGLIFAASRSEGKLRAYDENTGKVLRETNLPAGSEGVAAVYQVNGREFIVICICATSPESSNLSDSAAQNLHRESIAFALPKASGGAGNP
jgi:PQQ-like domain